MNKNSICSTIIKNYYKNKLILLLKSNSMINSINKLNNFIELRTKPHPLIIDETVWINKNYDELTILLLNKNLLKEINTFIKIYNNYYQVTDDIRSKLTNKKILSLWLILAFPEFIIDIKLNEINTNNQDYKTDLYVISKELHNKFMKLINNISNKEDMRKFNKQLNLYINSLDLYLTINKKEKLSNYIKEWLELEKSIQLINISNKYDDDNKNNTINIINKSKGLIEKYINQMIDNILLPETYDSNTNNIYDKLRNIALHQINIEANLKSTMEIMLKEEINNNIYNNISNILEDIKKFILTFTKIPENIINDEIDTKYIIQLIQHDVLTITDIHHFGENILNKICSAGSINLNNQQIKEWNIIIEEYKEDHKLIIGKLLRLSLETISLIIEEIACFQEYLLLIK